MLKTLYNRVLKGKLGSGGLGTSTKLVELHELYLRGACQEDQLPHLPGEKSIRKVFFACFRIFPWSLTFWSANLA